MAITSASGPGASVSALRQESPLTDDGLDAGGHRSGPERAGDVVLQHPRRHSPATSASAPPGTAPPGTLTGSAFSSSASARRVVRPVDHEATSTSVRGVLQHSSTLPAAISRGLIPPAWRMSTSPDTRVLLQVPHRPWAHE